MTTQRNPSNRVQPPDDLEPAGREAFDIIAHLAGRSCALRGVALTSLDSLLLGRIAQVVVKARQSADAGKLAEAGEWAALAQELAAHFWLTIPAALLPAIGRA